MNIYSCKISILYVKKCNIKHNWTLKSWVDTSNTEKKKYKVLVKNKNKKNLSVISSIKKPEKRGTKKQRKPKKGNGVIVHSNSATSISTSSVKKINTPITKQRWSAPVDLPEQGTRVQSLVWETPHAAGQLNLCTTPVTLKPGRLQPMPCGKKSHCNEKPTHLN